jgi:hypothetical protein
MSEPVCFFVSGLFKNEHGRKNHQSEKENATHQAKAIFAEI